MFCSIMAVLATMPIFVRPKCLSSKTILLLVFLLSFPASHISFAQEVIKRDLSRYQKTEIFDLGYSFTSGHATEEQTLAEARRFLWDNWQQKRLAYFIIRSRSMEGDPTTNYYYIESDTSGCWRVMREWESWCCGNMVMEGREKERTSGTDFYYNIERIDASTGKLIPDKEFRQPESYQLRLIQKTQGRAKASVKLL